MTREAGVRPARFPPLCTGNALLPGRWSLISTRSLGRPRSFAFEPEARKPCLLSDGSDHVAPGKSEWRRVLNQDSAAALVSRIGLKRPIVKVRTPSICKRRSKAFCILAAPPPAEIVAAPAKTDSTRRVPLRCSVLRHSQWISLFDNRDAPEVNGKSGAIPPLPSQL